MVAREEMLELGAPPSGRWTTVAQWREHDGALLAVFDHADVNHALALLPYGVEQLGGRGLEVVLPSDAVEATRHRAAFLAAAVEVHQEADGQVHATAASSQSEALAWYGSLGLVTAPVDVDELDGPLWLLDLVDWLESRRVERIRRSQYWSWHYRGRQILRVSVSSGTYRLLAGVAYSKPQGDQPAPVPVEAEANTGPTAEEVVLLKRALDDAIERRRVGIDRDHREHLLQAALALDPSMLGMTDLIREFPAWRPALGNGGGRGFIDFLGIEVDGGLHVIETKIGPDHMLGIQGLDYWAWVTAHKLPDRTDHDFHWQVQLPAQVDD